MVGLNEKSSQEAITPTRIVRAYMDLTDFEHELGHAPRTQIYATEHDLRRLCVSHIDECGIVEVEVRLVRVVQSSRFDHVVQPSQFDRAR